MAIVKEIEIKVDTTEEVKEVEKLTDAIQDTEKAAEKTEEAIEDVGDETKKTGKEGKKAGEDLGKGFDKGTKASKGLRSGIRSVGVAIKASGILLLAGVLAKVGDILAGEFISDSLTIAVETLSGIARGLGPSDALVLAKQINKERKEAELREVELQQLQLTSQILSERERQVRDDVTRSVVERIDANERLGKILEDQLKAEKSAALISLETARAQFERTGRQEDNLALRQAELKVIEIQERVEAQRSEQLTNQVALQQELGQIEDLRANRFSEIVGLQGENTLRNLELDKRRLEIQEEREVEALERQRLILGEGTVAFEQALNDRNEANKQFQINTLKTDKAIGEEKTRLIDQAATDAINILGKSSVAAKAIGIAQAIRNTFEGVTKALAASPPPFNFISAAAVAAAGFKAVKNIISTGEKATSAPATSIAQAPQFNVVGTSPTNQLVNAIGAQTEAQAAAPIPIVKAVVVASEVTTQQQADRQIVDTSTFG